MVDNAHVIDLAFNQLGIWTSQQLAPESSSLQAMMAVRILSELDVNLLRRALVVLVDRHPALRTTYHGASLDHSRPHQRVHVSGFELVCEEVDAHGWSDAKLRERVRADGLLPIDLGRGPLRVTVYTRAPCDHVLAFGEHHIGLDLVSMQLYLSEIPQLYEATMRDEKPALGAAASATYFDFVRSQAQYMTSAEAEASIAYWAKRLDDVPMALDLPLDRPRPPYRRARGATYPLAIDPELVRGLRGLGKSLNRTLLTAFQLLLFRYSGQTDMVTGMPADLRPNAGYGDVMGNFVNMLVLRFDLKGNPTVRELLSHVTEVVSEASKHRQIPLTTLIEHLRPKRDPSTTPFFQVAMGLQRMTRTPHLSAAMIPGAEWAAKMGPFDVQSFEVIEHEGQYDFELIASEVEGKVLLGFKYNIDIFDRGTVERMANNFLVLASAMVADPEMRIGSLPVMTDHERTRVLVEWNQTEEPLARGRCIHDLVVEAAGRAPDALALSSKDAVLSYGQLVQRARVVAVQLRRYGVGRDVIVPVIHERKPDAVVAMLGVLMAGGAYVPLDPTLPIERIATICRDTGARVAITTMSLCDVVRTLGVEVVVVDASSDDGASLTAMDHVSAPEDLAYVIYTSGSTGEPKGVLLQHLGLVSNVAWMHRYFGITAETRCAQVIALGFDGSILEIWPALAAGASLHFVDDETRLSPPRLMAWLHDTQIHFAVFPTPLAELCVDEPQELPAFRAMLAGGDKLHRPKTLPTFRLVNGYGPTESTVITTFAEIASADRDPPIGRPVGNTRVYLLDRQEQPVPIGAPGELCIGGLTIARGYLRRPELEAEKFIPDPFSSESGSRLYRTGDLARYCPDGSLEFLGRIDHQVKIRGFRIELGEIENVIARHPLVRENVVMVRELAGRPNLVSYVVTRDRVSRTELRAFLGECLPDYMIPTSFVRLDALPLTSAGKIDLRALPAPSAWKDREVIPPATPTEMRLAQLWAEKLELRGKTVCVNDDFFELGGDSLIAIQLAAQIKRDFNFDIFVTDILRKTTIRAQAAWIDIGAAASDDAPTLLTLREGARPALVVVHTILGSLVPYRPLAEVLGDDRAVLGLAAPSQAICEDMRAIAVAYIRLLREAEPKGPYVLCGWSFSGVLALEIAHQLHNQGAHVAHVVLIDPPFPTALAFPNTEAGLVERFFSFFLAGTPGGPPKLGYLDPTSADPLAAGLTMLQARHLLPRDLIPSQISSTYRSFRSYAIALHGHRLDTWHHPLSFFRATGTAAASDWGTALRDAVSLTEWQAVCPRMEVVEVAANHFGMLSQPHVTGIAERIAARLRR